jgi:hypothetical protein
MKIYQIGTSSASEKKRKKNCTIVSSGITPTYKNERRPKSRPNELAFAPFIFPKGIERIGHTDPKI